VTERLSFVKKKGFFLFVVSTSSSPYSNYFDNNRLSDADIRKRLERYNNAIIFIMLYPSPRLFPPLRGLGTKESKKIMRGLLFVKI